MMPQSLDDLTARYRRAVAEEWRYLTVTVHGEERRLPLERVFFMLQARERPEPKPTEPPRPDLDPARARLQDAGAPPPPQPPPPPVPLEAALAKGEHMALLGEPGAGKSTALQFIGLCFARADENWHRERLGIQRPYIPILLNLQARAHAIAGQKTLWDALRAEVRERLQCPEDEAEALLHAWRQEPGLLVLLDGLDEAPGALREAVRERIRRFAQSGAGWVILTSRPAGFQPLPGLREYLLKPFEDPEAEALPYLRGWLAALKPEWTAEEAGVRARELLERMRAHPALRRLLDNPLLLRLSAQHYAQAGEIARSRADLYRLWVEETWERARRRGAKEEEKPHFLEALQALAWHLHTGGGNEEADLLQALQRFGLAQEATEAEGLLRRLREQTGLLARLSEAEDGKARHRYVFSHQTLREYFVALRLKEAWERDARRAWRFLRPRLHLPDWREPLALLVSMLPELEALRLLEWILHARSPGEPLLRRDLFLAAALAAEGGQAEAMWRHLWPGLHRAIKSEKGWMSQAAVEALVKIGLPALHALVQMLSDKDWQVRREAAWALGEIGDPKAVPFLIRSLRDKDKYVRRAAAWALGKIGDPQVVPALIDVLKDEDWQVREAAVSALGEIGDPKAVPFLIQVLKSEPFKNGGLFVSWAAANAIGKIGDPQSIQPLIDALKFDENWEVRQAVTWALGKLGNPQVASVLIQTLEDERSWLMRREVVEALIQIGFATFSILIQALKSEKEQMCQVAVEALRKISCPSLPTLIQALKNEGLLAPGNAQISEQIDDFEIVQILAQELKNENWQIRLLAVWALGNIGNPKAIPALIQALQDENKQVRLIAAEALGKIGDSRAVSALIPALQDEDRDVRQAAVNALGKIGDPQVIPFLTRALQDEDTDVCQAAAEALGKIGDPQAIPALIQAFESWKIDLKKGSSKQTSSLEEILLQIKANWSVEVRQAIVKALGEIGDPQAVPALIDALKDEDWRVREAAVEALRKIGPPALPALIEMLKDKREWVRQATVQALGEIGDSRATSALIRALGDKDEGVRQAAAEALSKLPPIISPPQSEKERRTWQNWRKRILVSIWLAMWLGIAVRLVAREQQFELLFIVLERQAAWEAALSPWQDPLQPPPVPAWRAWARRAGRVALALLFAGLGALAMAVLSGIGEPLSEAVRAFVQRQPLWAALLAIVLIIVIAALLDWIREVLRKKT
jgi:HEAT repeat protein